MLLAIGMFRLRPAYLYREATGEGIAFVYPAMVLTGGAVLSLTAAGLLVLASLKAPVRRATVLRSISLSLVVVVLGCATVALWLVGRSGCVGACG